MSLFCYDCLVVGGGRFMKLCEIHLIFYERSEKSILFSNFDANIPLCGNRASSRHHINGMRVRYWVWVGIKRLSHSMGESEVSQGNLTMVCFFWLSVSFKDRLQNESGVCLSCNIRCLSFMYIIHFRKFLLCMLYLVCCQTESYVILKEGR